jgi:hypothetical protein
VDIYPFPPLPSSPCPKPDGAMVCLTANPPVARTVRIINASEMIFGLSFFNFFESPLSIFTMKLLAIVLKGKILRIKTVIVYELCNFVLWYKNPTKIVFTGILSIFSSILVLQSVKMEKRGVFYILLRISLLKEI